ncbi:MAG TPA: class I SAM-dependent methyltransferase, partial [Solirubrobacteraceae bacterium]|nr:class I SAM-dependent methyltransferase [Solirubrobacteraceae bacterium]
DPTTSTHDRDRPAFSWPRSFARIPDEEWTRREIHAIGRAYDDVDDHGWYANLDPVVEALDRELSAGDLLVDYSAGTGILEDRLRPRLAGRGVGILLVDAGARFLRVALEKHRDDPSVGMRLLHRLRDEARLQRLDEVLGEELLARGVDAIAVANAIHLYPDLDDVIASWARSLRPGGAVVVCSGNLHDPAAGADEWIIDETVWEIGRIAAQAVRSDARYAAYRAVLDDERRMAAYDAVRDRVFLRPRPLADYTAAFEAAGFDVVDVSHRAIEADVEQWGDFLSAYHDAVLGWVGGTLKADGAEPSPEAVADRLALMRAALRELFGERPAFPASWTYITCRRR